MGRNRSLDDFAGGTESDGESEDGGGRGEGTDAETEGGDGSPTDTADEAVSGTDASTETDDPGEVESTDPAGEAASPDVPDAPAETAGDAGGDEGETVDVDAVEPATVTYDWNPDGASCERCGATVERRWRDDGRRVCAECKEW